MELIDRQDFFFDGFASHYSAATLGAIYNLILTTRGILVYSATLTHGSIKPVGIECTL